MQTLQITCIRKTDRMNPHERIELDGGDPGGLLGSRWRMPLVAAIQAIENGTCQFFVSVGGKSVAVIIAKSAWGNKYLKTVADGEMPDNLLSLPPCL